MIEGRISYDITKCNSFTKISNINEQVGQIYIYEPSREKNNIADSA